MLKEYKKQNKDRHPTFVFLDSNHNHASNSAINKALKKACQQAGIKKITFHSLRHTWCSIFLWTTNINVKILCSYKFFTYTSTLENVYI